MNQELQCSEMKQLASDVREIRSGVGFMCLMLILIFGATMCSGCSGIPSHESVITSPDTSADTFYTSCWCCVWQPGTAYPDGNTACLLGDIRGQLCYAQPAPGADLPSWAPTSAVCPADDPWSGETSNGNMMAD